MIERGRDRPVKDVSELQPGIRFYAASTGKLYEVLKLRNREITYAAINENGFLSDRDEFDDSVVNLINRDHIRIV